jgi:cobyrinic acid a,c-diamide synthase
MSGTVKAVVIAGATSGAGKTTVATGIIGALVKRGLQVQPFKVGPDYIDPSYHAKVAQRPSRNLDTWMLPREAVVELFQRASSNADVSLVEGVMGLYDGHSVSNEIGSTAELAKVLGLPVLLVLDAYGAARSLAAQALGYKNFDPKLKLAGVIFNRIGSESHYQMCREAVANATGLAVLGYLPRRGDLVLPERHLGLVPMAETPAAQEFFSKLSAQVEVTIDLDKLLVIAAEAVPPTAAASLFPESPQPKQVRIAVARDKAFSFYYQDNLDLLEAWGAELISFSPLADTALPEGTDGIYIGGGFPEIYAQELAQNRPMLAALRQASGNGLPMYAECGGLMYLCRSLQDIVGQEHQMAGLLPVASHLDSTDLVLGYRTVRALADGPILKRGEEVRGHEFHWSRIDREPQQEAAYWVVEQGRREGFQVGSVLASYIHVHFASREGLAQRMVSFCKRRGDR